MVKIYQWPPLARLGLGKQENRITRLAQGRQGQWDVGDSSRGVKFNNRSRETILALAMGVSLTRSQVPLAWHMRD